MCASPVSKNRPAAAESGLRERQKAERRETILKCAERLFSRDGIDATTVTAIAEAAGVSPPTVFNYFGSKENILSTMVFEGTEKARSESLQQMMLTDCPFDEVIAGVMFAMTDKTIAIAGKRIWRYAEAAHIRRAGTEFQRRFDFDDLALRALIVDFLNAYDIALLNRSEPDTGVLADLVFDRWSARYFEFIKDDDMPLTTHRKILQKDAAALVPLVFTPQFAARSPLKKQEAAQ